MLTDLKAKRMKKHTHVPPSLIVSPKLSSLLGGCQAKRHDQAKDQEKEGFVTCSKVRKTMGIFPKAEYSWTVQLGKAKLREFQQIYLKS